MKYFVGLREKPYSYVKDNNDEEEKQKSKKKYIIKRKLKFEDYKNCVEAAEIENKIKHLEKNEIGIDSPKEFIKNNRLILKTQQKFKSGSHDVFTEEITKIA